MRLFAKVALLAALCLMLIMTSGDAASMLTDDPVMHRVIGITVILLIEITAWFTGRLIGALIHYAEGMYVLVAVSALSVFGVLLPTTSVVVPLGFPGAMWPSLCYVLTVVIAYREFVKYMPEES